MEKARGDYPGIWNLISFEAEMIARNRGPAAAFRSCRILLATIGGIPARRSLWAGSSRKMGDLLQAEEAFRHASWLDVHDAEA